MEDYINENESMIDAIRNLGSTINPLAGIENQLDLNDPKNLFDLEDPALQAHMDQARKILQEHETAQKLLPTQESLKSQNVEISSSLSNLILMVKSNQMILQISSDNLSMQDSKKIISINNEIGIVIKGLKDFERDLELMRHVYEKNVKGLRDRAQYFEKLYNSIEYLNTHQ
jgi:hypothetical protein